MNKSGPVIIIEDDSDDRELLTMIFKELNYENEIIFLTEADKVIEYLNQTHIIPFLILSDIHMPRLNGHQLRTKVKENAELTIKCIPYLFFTTSPTQQSVYDAYSASVQGFFIKPNDYDELKGSIKVIMDYWYMCYSPNTYGYGASINAYEAEK